MTESNDEKIVRLLRSESARDRNEGAKLLISTYKAKVVSWVKKQSGNVDPNDVWQSAAMLMILAIQSGKYQIQAGVQLYTFFHTIVFSTWAKLSKYDSRRGSLEDLGDTIPQEHEEFQPDIAAELRQKDDFIKHCFDKFDKRTQELLKAVVYEGKKINEIYEEFGLKNPNNAKQKIFTLKNKLIACLKNQMGYGK